MPSAKYYHKNKEYFCKQKRDWYQLNKERVSVYNAQRYTYHDYINKYQKINLLSSWKLRGFDFLNYTTDEIWKIYKETEECFYCGVSFENRKKNLDHCHDTGAIRGVICTSCNKLDVLKNIL